MNRLTRLAASSATTLHDTESWMFQVITDPAGVRLSGGRVVPAAPRHHGRSESFETLICSTPAWPAEERLGVYWNAYFVRLKECLREEFSILRQTLGEEIFDGFLMEYLRAHPPQSYTLSRLGEHLPTYLGRTRPPRDADEQSPDWADFLVDLADLEWTIGEVFDGPGLESREAALAASLAGVSSDSLFDARFMLSPALRLREFRFPVHRYHANAKAGQSPETPASDRSWIAVCRRNFAVRCHALDPNEFRLLRELERDQSLAQACDAVCGEDIESHTLSDIAAHIGIWFQRWTRYGFLERVASLETDG